MKRKYESPEMDIVFFTVSSVLYASDDDSGKEPGAGWEEEDEEF